MQDSNSDVEDYTADDTPKSEGIGAEPTKAKRKNGAPFGSRNAFKHGEGKLRIALQQVPLRAIERVTPLGREIARKREQIFADKGENVTELLKDQIENYLKLDVIKESLFNYVFSQKRLVNGNTKHIYPCVMSLDRLITTQMNLAASIGLSKGIAPPPDLASYLAKRDPGRPRKLTRKKVVYSPPQATSTPSLAQTSPEEPKSVWAKTSCEIRAIHKELETEKNSETRRTLEPAGDEGQDNTKIRCEEQPFLFDLDESEFREEIRGRLRRFECLRCKVIDEFVSEPKICTLCHGIRFRERVSVSEAGPHFDNGPVVAEEPVRVIEVEAWKRCVYCGELAKGECERCPRCKTTKFRPEQS